MPRPLAVVSARIVLSMALLSLAVAPLAACGPGAAPNDSEAVKQRAVEAQTARKRTGAELQDRALNRVIRAVYVCQNGENLTVDFDNPREMATVRTSGGLAVDLYQQRAADGIWYRASSHDLRGKGVLATWTVEGRDPTECRAVD